MEFARIKGVYDNKEFVYSKKPIWKDGVYLYQLDSTKECNIVVVGIGHHFQEKALQMIPAKKVVKVSDIDQVLKMLQLKRADCTPLIPINLLNFKNDELMKNIVRGPKLYDIEFFERIV